MRRYSKNARTVSTSSFEPAINPSSDLRPSSPIPQAARTAPPLARPQPLGDAVADEQIDDGVLGEIALAEVLVLGPKLLGDFTHRRPRQKPSARIVGERVLGMSRVDRPRA